MSPYELAVGLRYTRARRGSGRNSFISFIALVSMAGAMAGFPRVEMEDGEAARIMRGNAIERDVIGTVALLRREGVQPEMAGRVTRGLSELCTWIGRDGALQGAQRPAGLGGWETHKLSALGECTYATGVFLRLLSQVATSRHLSP